MTAAQTARQRARAELTSEIKDEARRQLAAGGSQQLSLRAVARELGMASSALYRYFPSRDDLLTALIIDAYDGLGEHAERAVAALPRSAIRGRWRACCHAVRDWAITCPHEYALIFGSPVPGYRAPRDTVGPAIRVPTVLGGLLADACADRAADPAPDPRTAAAVLPQPLERQSEQTAALIAPGVPAAMIMAGLIAWTQLFGMVSFELFGHFVGTTDPADEFFAYAVDQMASLAGLPPGPPGAGADSDHSHDAKAESAPGPSGKPV